MKEVLSIGQRCLYGKNREKKSKAAPRGQKVEHANFKEADSGIDENEIDNRPKNDGCHRCSIPGHK